MKAIVDDSFVLVGLDSVLSFGSLLVDLVLLGSNEGTLVNIGVDFNVRVVAQFESILRLSALSFSLIEERNLDSTWDCTMFTYPLAVIQGHLRDDAEITAVKFCIVLEVFC